MSKNEKLQQYFDFTQVDLQENRQGRVSEEQQLIVKEKAQRFNNNILVVLIFIVFISAGTFVFVRSAASGSINFSFAMLGPAITIVVMAIYMISRSRKKNDFTLQKVEGMVNFVWVEERVRNHSNAGPDYKTVRRLQMRVGGVSFNVKEELMDIINQGEACRFYYTGGGDIVSAEVLDRP